MFILSLWPAALQALGQMPPGLSYQAPPARNKELPRIDMLLDGERFHLEVALDKADLLQGLMYREHLPDKHGMLFPFWPPRIVNFWMKNTRIPLDMLFIRDKVIVYTYHDVPPCTQDPCPTYNSLYPVDMVVELPAGTARHYAIEIGDPIQFDRPQKPGQPEDEVVTVKVPPSDEQDQADQQNNPEASP